MLADGRSCGRVLMQQCSRCTDLCLDMSMSMQVTVSIIIHNEYILGTLTSATVSAHVCMTAGDCVHHHTGHVCAAGAGALLAALHAAAACTAALGYAPQACGTGAGTGETCGTTVVQACGTRHVNLL